MHFRVALLAKTTAMQPASGHAPPITRIHLLAACHPCAPSALFFQIVGVLEPKIGTAIQDGTSISCNSNETVLELARGIRAHFTHYVGALASGEYQW